MFWRTEEKNKKIRTVAVECDVKSCKVKLTFLDGKKFITVIRGYAGTRNEDTEVCVITANNYLGNLYHGDGASYIDNPDNPTKIYCGIIVSAEIISIESHIVIVNKKEFVDE